MAKQGREEVPGVQDEGEEEMVEVATRRNDAQQQNRAPGARTTGRRTPEQGELRSTVEDTVREGREGGREVGEHGLGGRKSVAGRRGADRVKDSAPCKRAVFIHDQPNHRRVGGSPARKNHEEFRNRSNNSRDTDSGGRSNPSECSACIARRGSRDSTTPCNPISVGIKGGKGQGIYTTNRAERTTG